MRGGREIAVKSCEFNQWMQHHLVHETRRLAEREEISRGIASGSSIREIARNLQRSASTVGREVARHRGCPRYRSSKADHQACNLALRPCVLALHRQLIDVYSLVIY
jgi:IS30 family transposase